MSNSLSQTEMAALDELRQAFGEITETPNLDDDHRQLATFVTHIRGLLSEATHSDQVSITDLAKILGVSKAAVSRHLLSDGDIKASTMWMLANALGREWEINLVKKMPCSKGNSQRAMDARSGQSTRYIEAPVSLNKEDFEQTKIKPELVALSYA